MCRAHNQIEYTGSIAKVGRQERGCPIDCRLKTRDRHYQRVAGVPAGVDAWVKTFVAKKARSVITDVTELEVVSDGLLHTQLLDFCQNARKAFLGRNTPTPLLSEFMAQVDSTIVEAVCRHGTRGGHVGWSPRLRKFANMKIQVPHFGGGFGITPNEGSAISVFYSATFALVVWLGSHGGNRPAQGFADAWAPRLDLTSPDSWHAPLLQALSSSHALLLEEYGCVESSRIFRVQKLQLSRGNGLLSHRYSAPLRRTSWVVGPSTRGHSRTSV